MVNKINNERGVALITALLVLAILTMLGLAAILTSTTDIQIASNEKVATQGQYAAEAGISEVVARLNPNPTPTIVPQPVATWGIATSTWVASLKGTTHDSAGTFFNYSARVEYKKVPAGRMYAGRVAFYNKSSGFSDPAPDSGGWPVFRITSVASKGNFQIQPNILEITKSTYRFNIQGAFSAGGNVTLQGNPSVDGSCYPATGADYGPPSNSIPCNCADANLQTPKPSVYTSGTYTSGGTVNIGTAPGVASPTAQNQPALPTTPWAAMGLKLNAADGTIVSPEVQNGPYFEDVFPGYPAARPFDEDELTGKQYYTTSSNNDNITGNGVLILHNPLFVPGACTCPAGGLNCWNAANEADDPDCAAANAPATLDANGGQFNGVVIADQISLRGNVIINGAVISLSTLSTTATGAGTPQILFSCAAIEQFASGKINQKLNWHKE